MGLDIRLPIGAMFLFVGVLLTIYGTMRPSASTSVGVNINLTWGAILLVFGLIMILLGRRGSRLPRTSAMSTDPPARRGH